MFPGLASSVSRLVCKSHTFDVNMRIDVATDVYPMKQGQKFRMALAQTLRLDGKPDDGTYDQSGEVRPARVYVSSGAPQRQWFAVGQHSRPVRLRVLHAWQSVQVRLP